MDRESYNKSELAKTISYEQFRLMQAEVLHLTAQGLKGAKEGKNG